jgi:penicillin-binding protein 2
MSTNQPARSSKRANILAVLAVVALLAPSPELVQSAFAAGGAAATRHSRRTAAIPTRGNPTKDDVSVDDDAIVRAVAVNALGNANGSVLAIDPATGRILAAVNQKMVFSSGFEPCSTIKPVIALAGLEEGIITRDTMINVGRRRYMDLTEAMAHSNNEYFQAVGERLGFERVSRYAKLLGLGELAGLNIDGEQPGALPVAPPAYGGIARMSSFGSGIRMTPLQLASLVSTLANGGTMYYLQYPRTNEARANFTPQIKRKLDIGPLVPDLQEGMLAAVLYGTGKSSYDPYGEQALGKTGTCNDEGLGGRLGWFVSYADQIHPKIVIVVLLRGNSSRIVSGPRAADVAGRIYRELRDKNYFATMHGGENNYATAPAASALTSNPAQARR